MAAVKERKKVTELLKIEEEIQKKWDTEKAFEADAEEMKSVWAIKLK